MTKQEIEKAIENGESVWVNGIEHKLDKYYFVAEYNNEPTLYLMTCGYEEDDWNNYPVATITNIYKTKAETEHYLNHANVKRVEQLPFVTWEEFLEEKELFFTNRSGYPMCLRIVDTKLGKKIGLGGANGYFDLQQIWDLTEANFYKAYDECVRLFKGEI